MYLPWGKKGGGGAALGELCRGLKRGEMGKLGKKAVNEKKLELSRISFCGICVRKVSGAQQWGRGKVKGEKEGGGKRKVHIYPNHELGAKVRRPKP